LRGGWSGARASQLIYVPLRSVAEAYHAPWVERDIGCQIIFFQSPVCVFFKTKLTSSRVPGLLLLPDNFQYIQGLIFNVLF
jgi:hypothetical protein